MAKKVIFVPNVRAQCSSGEWLQGKERNPAGTSLSCWVRPCSPASSPKAVLETVRHDLWIVLQEPVVLHHDRDRRVPYGWLLIRTEAAA